MIGLEKGGRRYKSTRNSRKPVLFQAVDNLDCHKVRKQWHIDICISVLVSQGKSPHSAQTLGENPSV